MKKEKIILPKKLSSDLAYLCGVLAGDGGLYFRKEKYEYFLKCVGNPADEKVFYKKVIKPKFKKIFKYSIKTRYLDQRTTFGFTIYSKKLIKYLSESIGLPIGWKYNKLKIPEIFKKKKVWLKNFVMGIFDTDGCICFKRRYRDYPYYPVISISSKSKMLIKDLSSVLKRLHFKLVESYDYKKLDTRAKAGFTIINRIDLNGKNNFILWMKTIGFSSPKHLAKIRKFWK